MSCDPLSPLITFDLPQGHRIPANTVVLNNLYSVHMDPDYWGDPETFRPERFINPDGSLRREERLITFGKGEALNGEGLCPVLMTQSRRSFQWVVYVYHGPGVC